MKTLLDSIHLDFRSHIPIYTQIVEQVKQQLVSGLLKPGDQLPTVRALALELRVNFNTVARAYRLLDEAGIISTQQGRGTFIWEQPDQENVYKFRRKGLDDKMSRVIHEMQRLGYNADEVETVFKKQIELWRAKTLSDE